MTNRPTSYEVAIYKNGEVIRVLGFSERHTKGALLSFAQSNGDEVAALCTDAELDADYVYSAARGSVSFGSASVAFTGYTRIDRAMAA